MSFWQSVILGLVEGITEFLPISSTGHLILASALLKISTTSFTKSFDIIIQLGAITAVIFLYWKKLWQPTTIKKLIVAFLPTGAVGLLLYSFLKNYLLGSKSVVIWSLFLGGIALIVFEKWHKKSGRNDENGRSESGETISYRQAATIGLFQALAIIPGVSRSAATIVGGLWLGLRRTTIVEFSFLLAIPTMLAASGLDLLKNYSSFSQDQFGILAIGFIVSFFVAMASITLLLKYIQKHDFRLFGAYRILIAILFWIMTLNYW